MEFLTRWDFWGLAVEVSVVGDLRLSRSLANIAAQSRKASKASLQLKKHYYYNGSPIIVLGLILSHDPAGGTGGLRRDTRI